MLVDTAVAFLPYTIAKFCSSVKLLLHFTHHTHFGFSMAVGFLTLISDS